MNPLICIIGSIGTHDVVVVWIVVFVVVVVVVVVPIVVDNYDDDIATVRISYRRQTN